ncbi:MAG: phospholipid carrier-dependent glycosyltransferase, partial [Gemmatimonadetes bacterium]|nr:phospholipid carrier-dependent glycosyltransferase [Gemmatimonadota bacterium]
MSAPILRSQACRIPRSPSRAAGGAVIPLSVAALAGVVAAAWSAGTPQGAVAIVSIGLPLLLVTGALSHLLPDPASRADLPTIVFGALVLRLLAFAVIRLTVGPYVFAPDALTYEVVGEKIVLALTGQGGMPMKAVDSLQIGYYWLTAGFFWLFGEAAAGPALLNVFLGAWTTVPVYFLARTVVRGNRGVARWTAGLVAVFPSLTLWSALNLREAPTIFLLALGVYAFVRLGHSRSPRDLLVGLACLGGILLSRGYLALLVGIGVPIGLLLSRGRTVGGRVVAMAGLAGAVALSVVMDIGPDLTVTPTLETLEAMRRGLGEGARTAYGAAHDVSNPTGAARFFPVGLAYYLFAPFPWDLGSTLQWVTLPETLLWYALIPFAARGALVAYRHEPRAYGVLTAVIVAIIVPYALVQGNVGTAYRHRAQILPLVFVFVAIGLRDALAAAMASRRERGRMRLRAGARQRGGNRSASPPSEWVG